MSFRIGSLFAGIGGLELGLEWAGLGRTVWQIERDPRCRAVLAKHWPEAKRYEDVREVGSANLAPVDLICGGFPCQDVSSAGAGAGLAGARSGLWFEFARVVGELGPRWVVIENVASGASRWLDAVRESLEQLGYVSLPVPLSAADVGARHERARIFVVANAARHRRAPPPRWPEQGPAEQTAAVAAGVHGWASQPDVLRVANGVSSRLDRPGPRIRQLGNSVVPQCAEVIGHVIRQLGGMP